MTREKPVLPCEASIRRILDTIKDPCSVANSLPMGLAEMGLIRSIDVGNDGSVVVDLRLTSPFCEMIAFFQNEVMRLVATVPGVTAVRVTNDAGFDWDADMMAPSAKERRRERLAQLGALMQR